MRRTRAQWVALGAGRVPDRVIGERLGIASETVGEHRRRHDIASVNGRRAATAEEKGQACELRRKGMSCIDIADIFERNVQVIRNWTAGAVGPRFIDWDAELREGEPGYLAESAGAIASRLGVTRQAVSYQAHRRGLRGRREFRRDPDRAEAIALRREKGWSAKDIGEVLGRPPSTVSKWIAKEGACRA